MGVYKDNKGTWFVSAWYKNWAGETKNETGIFYKTRDIRLETRVYCHKHWKSSLSVAQWAPCRQRNRGDQQDRVVDVLHVFFRFFRRLSLQKRSCETGNYIVRNVKYSSAIVDTPARFRRCRNSFVFNAQSSLKSVRPSGKKAPAGQETKKDNKNIIQKMIFYCPSRLLDTIFNILILTCEDLRHNRKTVPMSCRCSAYFIPWEIRLSI